MSDSATPNPAASKTSVTHHTLNLPGKPPLPYRAQTGLMTLSEESADDEKRAKHKATASIFYIAYTHGHDQADSTRPITFVFNGGPGSSSVWLHLGAFGPWRVCMTEKGEALPPPHQLVPNEQTLLDITDLVFIDPVGTGYSRMLEGEPVSEYHSFQRDLDAVGEFIRLYCTLEGRWASPKYLAGESYGTTRAAGLAQHLQGRYGMYLNGVVLISTVLDFQTLLFETGNDLPYALFLPSYAASAHYHGCLAEDVQAQSVEALLAEVEAFVMAEYVPALFAGSSLDPERQRGLIQKLSRYTGLSEQEITRSHARIQDMRFMASLLRDRQQILGRLDTRLHGYDADSASEVPSYDPSYAAIQGVYASAFNAYIKDTLEFECERIYEVLIPLYRTWTFEQTHNRFANVHGKLCYALVQNPHMRVHVASGIYDLATPYYATAYTLNHLHLPEHLQAKISHSSYPAGHMMYTHTPSLTQLGQTLKAWYRST